MSKWFERHPRILERESTQLQESRDYEELTQQRNQLFVSAGSFVVRFNGEVLHYPAAVVYPVSTPYVLPRVFLLAEPLVPAEVTELAALDEDAASTFLKPKARFYHQRHQNGDGSLCLLEQDNVDREGVETFDAYTILRRVRQWLSGLSTGYFPPESNEIELVAHYPNRLPMHVLLTDDFYRADVAGGQFYLQPVVKFEGMPPSHFIGACLVGQQTSGLYIDSPTAPLRFMPEGLQTQGDLLLHPERLTYALAEKKLVEGHWWQLAVEPLVYEGPLTLATAISQVPLGRGAGALPQALWPQLKVSAELILVGLRFPNRRGELEWLLLALAKKRSDHPPLLNAPNGEEVLLDYDLVALFSEPFTEAAFYLRNAGRIDQANVRQQTATLLGCGALGGELADCLGKAGVGNIWLTDNQEMRAHNTVRHLAGIDCLGLPKVLAVKQIIFEHNRFVAVTCRMANVLRQPLESYFAPTGIGISSMADDNTEGYVNEQAVTQGRTVYYVRALRGGKAARIFRVRPGQDACFHCLALHKQEGASGFPLVLEDEGLPTIRNECNNPVRPASAADLKLIAALASRLILDQLQSEVDSATNHWVWTTEPSLGLGATVELPQALLARQLPPHPACSICQPQLKAVFIQSSALHLMQQLTRQTPGIETGGILVGRVREGHELVVEVVSEPGPQARRSAIGFDRDVAYCQRFVDEQATAGRLYLGEWHSHPTENNQPSQTDLDSLSLVAQQPGYLTTQPIMIIMSRSGEPACTVHPVGKPHYVVPLVEQASDSFN